MPKRKSIEQPRTFHEIVETEQSPENLNNMGIKARIEGHYDMARLCFERSVEIGDKPNEIENQANFCDLDRLGGDLERALATIQRGIDLAKEEAERQGIGLGNIGEGLQGKTSEEGEYTERLWFAYAKALNFKALTHRFVFDKSGKNDFSALRESIALNEEALKIIEKIIELTGEKRKGYRFKIMGNLGKDLVESDQSEDWGKAIKVAKEARDGTQSLVDKQTHWAIEARALDKLGKEAESLSAYREALKTAEEVGAKRGLAGALCELTAALYRFGRNKEVASLFPRIKFGDLAASDLEHLRPELEDIKRHHGDKKTS